MNRLWEIPITVENIERMAFNQIRAITIAKTRRGLI